MIYLGIGDLPIYNFDKILKSNNLAYMVIGWNEREEIEIPKEAQSKWDEVYNEYCERTANNEALTFYSLTCEVGYLEMRYTAIFSLVQNLCEPYKEEIGRRLNKWKVPFNIKGSIKKQLPQLETQLRIAFQNIKIKKNKLEALKGDEEEQSTVLQQKIKLERIVGLKIDLKTTSVEEWIEINNEAKSIIEQQKAVKNG